ncbi:MAG TPA: LUD domain-containing protein [Patescibacteria group bacterium]|jgi:hypothetical protein|nr:LUD domain-containing protein [Patescibacteria group bacterium]
MNYDTIPSDEVINRAVESLKANGIETFVVANSEEAKAKVLELIPEQSEVMTMTSETLRDTGITAEIDESGNFDSVRNKLNSMDGATQSREMRKLGAAPDFTLGSVHAITEDGRLLIASNTGSQLPAYLYGAGTVVWVAGAQKITPNLEEAKRRVYEYVLPLESERAHKAYGVEGSFVSKLVTFNREVNPARAKLIIVKEKLGF